MPFCPAGGHHRNLWSCVEFSFVLFIIIANTAYSGVTLCNWTELSGCHDDDMVILEIYISGIFASESYSSYIGCTLTEILTYVFLSHYVIKSRSVIKLWIC